jgi:hypothetical protein
VFTPGTVFPRANPPVRAARPEPGCRRKAREGGALPRAWPRAGRVHIRALAAQASSGGVKPIPGSGVELMMGESFILR